MINGNWLSDIAFYVFESSIEVGIIFLIVQGLLRIRKIRSASIRRRYLILPLTIPVLFSPALHLIFPALERIAIITWIESALPVLGRLRPYEQLVMGVLMPAFIILFSYNVLSAMLMTLRERRSISLSALSFRSDWTKRLTKMAVAMKVPLPKVIFSHNDANSAYAFGWGSPIVVIGRAFLNSLDADETEAVLAHELAHYRQRDTWLKLILKTCRDLMFFNPLTYLIYDMFERASEEAADDLAVYVTHKPLALASGLLKCTRIRNPASPVLAGNLCRQPRQLESRIRRLLDHSPGEENGATTDDGAYYLLSVMLTFVFTLV